MLGRWEPGRQGGRAPGGSLEAGCRWNCVGEDNACSSLTLGRHQVLLDEYRALHTRKANYWGLPAWSRRLCWPEGKACPISPHNTEARCSCLHSRILFSPPTHPAGSVVVVKSLSCVRLFAAPWTVAHQAPLSMEFSRKDDWNGLHFPLQLATQGMYFCPLVA